MPELVELRVRGGERRRVAVAEPDDRDPADEVEVAAAVVVLEPRAVAAHERDVRARIRLEQRRADDRRGGHATTAVRADLGAHAELRRGDRRAQLRDDPALERARVEQLARLLGVDHGDDDAAVEQPGNVRDEEDALGLEPDRERGGHLVRVDVQRPGGERRDDRDQLLVERGDHDVRCARDGIADHAEHRHLQCVQSDLVAEQRDRRARRSPQQSAAFTSAIDSRTTSSASLLVTRRPPMNCTSRPRRSISALICGPAPCTTTTGSVGASSRIRSAALSATAPPHLTTIGTVTSGSPR